MKTGRLHEKIVLRIVIVPLIVCVAGPLWAFLGFMSLRSLGQALEKTGRNLQEYTW